MSTPMVDIAKLAPDQLDLYLRGVAEGYSRAKADEGRVWLDLEGVMARYEVGENRARGIIQAIRHHCNGGLLNAAGKVLISEAIAWENAPQIKFKARL